MKILIKFFCYVNVVSTLIVFCPSWSWADEIAVSARRLPQQSWQEALSDLNQNTVQEPNSVLRLRKQVGAAHLFFQDVGGIPAWPGTLDELNQLNQKSLQVRSYQNPNQGNYLRRAPWMFPADGCYAKAAHVSAQAQAMNYMAPGKVFAFGDLRFRSDYVNGGIVYWSYHVVSSYHINGQIYVIDPVVSQSHPLSRGNVMTLAQWSEQISPRPQTLEISLCDAHAYTPASPCLSGRGNGAYLGHIDGLLRDEYQNLLAIGYTPDLILGPGTGGNQFIEERP